VNVTLVDPSLFTAPYDAALTQGLLAAGVRPTWMTRPVRRGDRQEIPAELSDAFFYRRVDDARWLPHVLRPLAKGVSHVAGTVRLVWKIRRTRPDVVHLQWTVMPLVDVAAMTLIKRWCPLVLTVHDTVAFNGERMSWPQRLGHELPAKLADRLIVHTQAGRQVLIRRGLPADRISVIPHGPLALPVAAAALAARDPRWTLVLFGELKPYKGLDVLIEAIAALPAKVRAGLRVIVAGRPRMDVAPLAARIAALGIGAQFELRLRRLSEGEMAALFAQADAFVFPYRHVDASGVYYLVRALGKWLIATRVGVFAEAMSGEPGGVLVPPEDVPALAAAIADAAARRPAARTAPPAESWAEIGRATRAVYEQVRERPRSRAKP
jgi:glycosyltransferase involved in cell wall biosynthesis